MLFTVLFIFVLVSYYYPFPPVGPVLYHMELSIGGQQFHGKGRTRQAAKHDAAAKAIKYLQKEPIMQQLAEVRVHTTNMMNGAISRLIVQESCYEIMNQNTFI